MNHQTGIDTYQILDWDSNLFGFKVALITDPEIDTVKLETIFSILRTHNVKLVYWPSKKLHDKSEKHIKRLNGYLVDEKTTFSVKTEKIGSNDFVPKAVVTPYDSTIKIANLESLAIQSGKYSRFNLDPNIPREKFIDLYTSWINRSVTKEIADEILVINKDSKTIAIVSLSGNNRDTGSIGLLSVDADYLGLQYGETLVRAAQNWFVAQGYRYGQVVTQKRNVPACKLYSKCGFSIEKIEYYYHFWL